MNHQWKAASLQTLIKYNQWLLVSLVLLSVLSLSLGIAMINKEERWVLIPMTDIDRRMEVSNNQLYPSYLKNWAIHVAKEMFTTSPAEVVSQHAEIRKISITNKELSKFFAEQFQFIQGSNASSVFFVKAAVPFEGGIKVTGTLHYWFTNSPEKIALEKSYLISYKEVGKGLILLSNIEEFKELIDAKN